MNLRDTPLLVPATCFLPGVAEDWNGPCSRWGMALKCWQRILCSWEDSCQLGSTRSPSSWEIQLTQASQGNSLVGKYLSLILHEWQVMNQHLSIMCGKTPAQPVLFFKPFLLSKVLAPLGLPPQQTHTAKTPNFFKNNLFVSDHKVQ